MEITEVRIKLMEEPGERLKAFCSITFDDCFVVRDLKIIEGANGPFVAMPSRKLTAHCGSCRAKNHLRAGYCNQCGVRLKEAQTVRDEEGRAKLYADIAHPINTTCREMIQQRVVAAFEEERVRSRLPGYVPTYEDFDQGEAVVDLRADGPAPPAGPSRPPQSQPQAARVAQQAQRVEAQAQRVETQAPRVEPQAAPAEPQVVRAEKPQGPHKAPAHPPQPTDRPKPDGFGAGNLRVATPIAMTPEAALQRQIECYRRMTGEQRLAIALDLHEFACDVAREGIRHDHPKASAEEVERYLRRRIELSRE